MVTSEVVVAAASVAASVALPVAAALVAVSFTFRMLVYSRPPLTYDIMLD